MFLCRAGAAVGAATTANAGGLVAAGGAALSAGAGAVASAASALFGTVTGSGDGAVPSGSSSSGARRDTGVRSKRKVGVCNRHIDSIFLLCCNDIYIFFLWSDELFPTFVSRCVFFIKFFYKSS